MRVLVCGASGVGACGRTGPAVARPPGHRGRPRPGRGPGHAAHRLHGTHGPGRLGPAPGGPPGRGGGQLRRHPDAPRTASRSRAVHTRALRSCSAARPSRACGAWCRSRRSAWATTRRASPRRTCTASCLPKRRSPHCRSTAWWCGRRSCTAPAARAPRCSPPWRACPSSACRGGAPRRSRPSMSTNWPRPSCGCWSGLDAVRGVLELGGGEVVTYRTMLARYRDALGLGDALWLPVPMPLMAFGAWLAEALPQRVFCRDTLRLLAPRQRARRQRHGRAARPRAVEPRPRPGHHRAGTDAGPAGDAEPGRGLDAAPVARLHVARHRIRQRAASPRLGRDGPAGPGRPGFAEHRARPADPVAVLAFLGLIHRSEAPMTPRVLDNTARRANT